MDAIRTAEVIVDGTIGAVAVLPAGAVPDVDIPDDRTPTEITFTVDEYLKGFGPAQLRIYQTAEEILYDGERITGIWTSGTSCGRQVDVGVQAIVLLSRIGSDMYSSVTPLDEGGNPEFIRQILAEQAADSSPTQFPNTGAGPDPASSSLPTLAIAGALGVALASGALLLGRRIR